MLKWIEMKMGHRAKYWNFSHYEIRSPRQKNFSHFG